MEDELASQISAIESLDQVEKMQTILNNSSLPIYHQTKLQKQLDAKKKQFKDITKKFTFKRATSTAAKDVKPVATLQEASQARSHQMYKILKKASETSVRLEYYSNSIFIIQSTQLRLSNCNNCSIYCSTTSNPIIEDCNNMIFYTFPGCIKQIIVEDFNWLRKDVHSPNWTFGGEGNVAIEEVEGEVSDQKLYEKLK